MIKQMMTVSVAMLSATVVAMPTLQPCVKEYRVLESAAFNTAELPVFHQDQRQCVIGAAETFVKGERKIWDGKSAAANGVYLAIADSACGKKLIEAFSLDVPAKPQGYAIKAEGRRVAIVGHDDVGALYGAVTFAQMSRNGRVEAAYVRDWPDVLYRGSISFGRGLWKFRYGEKDEKGYSDAIKAGLDMMLRAKMNLFSDLFWLEEGMPDSTFPFFRELGRYAAERGIWCNYYATTGVYIRRTAPKGMKFDDWKCVKLHCPWNDSYYCWADDALTEAAANRTVDFLVKAGMEKAVVNIHPVDGGSWQDPEEWSKRCEKCRAKWNDHERWKASINQFNIWIRVFRKRLPGAVVGSCIYPYQFNALMKPESERTAKWKESMPEYWDKLDKGLADKEFYFSSWITTPDVIKTVRELVPERPFHLSDTYPLTAGIFASYPRKIGSSCEGGRNFATTQGTECYLQIETLLLVNEHLWDLHAPGTENYDGLTYYDGLKDHVAPDVIMKDSLGRICRTFWGDVLAPYMQTVLSSGVMPEYLRDPAAKVKYWNKVRRDPDFDPTQPEKSKNSGSLKYPPIIDTPELMLAQVEAAERCVHTLLEAEKRLDGLDRYKRKHFMRFLKYAPYWLATARTHHVVRLAGAALYDGDNAKALGILKEGRVRIEKDFDLAETTFKRLEEEADTLTDPRRPRDASQTWKFDRKAATTVLDQTEASARITLEPRKIGAVVKLGVHRGGGDVCIKEYFDQFENVKAEYFDSISLAELNRFDCVFLTQKQYEKDAFFTNVKAYVEKGGGGVFLEGELCGNVRFDVKTPFPEIVKTSPARVENFKRKMKFADGREGETMYVDYFRLTPGAKGEVLAYGPNSGDVLAVRGVAGLGKVFFSGTLNIGSVADSYATRACPLFGANAEFAREAVEYFTNVRLKEKDE